MKKVFCLCFIFFITHAFSSIELGVDLFFKDGHFKKIKGKRIGIITNHTGVDSNLRLTLHRFLECKDFSIKAVFSPEHGLFGSFYANQKIKNNFYKKIPIYSLYGKTKRPTESMLKDIDVLVYDIQDLGSRSYTYITTLFYAMEEAAKQKIEFIVLDRPNPLGNIVDGPMLEKEYRSFTGYINVPYCHGMSVGELSIFFNKEYKINCNLKVVKMKNWNRKIPFLKTKLHWIPTSPYIPEKDTAFFYPSTGILGELNIVNIGIGYTLPFKIVGAPWINAKIFAKKLNQQNLKGVFFLPFHFKPFYGIYKNENCHGIKIIITDYEKYKPVSVQYLILGVIKSLYKKEFLERLKKSKIDFFCKINGTRKIYDILIKEPFPAWKLIEFQTKQNKNFLKIRKKYLFSEYN